MCGNNKFHRNGVVGKIYRFIMGTIPSAMQKISAKILPKKCRPDGEAGCLGKGGPCRYFIFFFYVSIYVGFIAIYVTKIHPNIETIYPDHVTLHKILTFVVLPGPWIICLMLQFMDPGTITPENVKSYLEVYKFDNRLYQGKECPTLHLPVPARSRYCNYTKRRIARYDHYCPWMLASIGERTQRFFPLFLLGNIIPSAYYAWGSYKILKAGIVALNIRWSTSIMKNVTYMAILSMRDNPLVLGELIMLTGIAVSMSFFLIQQIYYISRNITQVELDKIEMWKEYNSDKKYVHFYSNGFFENWKEVLFPPKIAKHAPVTMDDFDRKQFPAVERIEHSHDAHNVPPKKGNAVHRRRK